jgi:Fur family ferric uptake transcriptional regulator
MQQSCKMDKETIYKNIRIQGGRITKIRKAIVQIIFASECLISQADIISQLKVMKLYPDRSTLFRELLFLNKNNIVFKNTLLGIDYYEIQRDHHHHLVCINCKTIEKFAIRELSMVEEGNLIAKKRNFNIINHSLEFYGLCHNCSR